jgi:hypothetical protein
VIFVADVDKQIAFLFILIRIIEDVYSYWIELLVLQLFNPYGSPASVLFLLWFCALIVTILGSGQIVRF